VRFAIKKKEMSMHN